MGAQTPGEERRGEYEHSGASRAHTHTVRVCSSALTPSSARTAPAGPRDLQGHPDTADQKSATHSLKHGLAAWWAAAVCTAVPH